MPSHSERVRRNYDPEETAGRRPESSERLEWVDEPTEPLATGHAPQQIPLSDEDDSNAAERKPG